MAGRPPKVKVKDLINGVDEYIENANPPIVAEYAHLHGITRSYLYQLADREEKKGNNGLSNAIKKISEAKEIRLEQGGLSGEYKPNMAIFSLKQLGWRDEPAEADDKEAFEHLDRVLEEIGGVV
ncbi:MAG: hypothetical protein II931_00010 [Clostridia bacterium]|jgi:hypothetical protein|nr:hypothetical protein [Clostridia bacterium]